MALTVEQIFDAVAPAYAAAADKATFLELSAQRTSAHAFGGNYNYAVALLAAHLIEIAQGAAFAGSGGSGPVKSKKEGDLSISYGGADAAADSSDLSLTKYGRQLQSLRRGNIAAVGVTGGRDVGY
jgi:hypothetical protein